MAAFIFPAILLGGAFLLALGSVLFLVGSLRLTNRIKEGLFPYAFYALFFSNGLSMMLSSRNFSLMGEQLQSSMLSNPAAEWAIRLSSLLVLVASVDHMAKALRAPSSKASGRILLVSTFILYWLTNLAIPAVFATHTASPQLTWTYVAAICIGLIYSSGDAATRTLLALRNACIAFTVASLVMIVFKPALVLQSDYSQGLLGGVPRFFGLAPHAIMMGSIICVGIWALIYYPLEKRWQHRVAMGAMAFALFLTQAKAVWITFFLTLPILLTGRNAMPTLTQLASPRWRSLVVACIGVVLVMGMMVALQVMTGSTGQKIARFLDSDQGAQLTSFTGRDRIWAVALDEWAQSPLFGYGLPVFGAEHRARIGMWFASSGHNQVIDNLARTGLIGTVGMVLYSLTLLGLSLRYFRQTRGLSAVLSVSLLIRMISEVPLSVSLLGLDSLPHFMLLAVLAKAIFEDFQQRESNTRLAGGRAGLAADPVAS